LPVFYTIQLELGLPLGDRVGVLGDRGIRIRDYEGGGFITLIVNPD